MALEINDFDFEEGTTNMGGGRGKVFACPASDIDEMTIAFDATDKVWEVTALTCKTGKKFASIYATPDTVGITSKSAGEKDAMSFEPMIEWLTPGMSSENIALKTALNNGGYVMIGGDQDGLLAVGHPDYPAYAIGGDATIGKQPKDRRGITHQMQAPSPYPALRLASGVSVPLTPAA